jgi:hypothetical protein
MSRKIIKFIGLGIAVLLILGIAINQVQTTLAKKALLERRASNELPILPTNEELPAAEYLEPLVSNPPVPTQITPEPQVTEEAVNQPVQNFIRLTGLHQTQMLKSGWFHWVFQVERDYDVSSSPMPNGLMIPENLIMDEWMLLDETGIVTKAIHQMLTLEGKTVQLSTYANGVWNNYSTGETFEEKSVVPGLDFGFATKLELAAKTGSLITQTSTILEGVEVTLFVISQEFGKPIQSGSLDQAVIGGEIRGYVDSMTGAFKLVEMVYKMEDGSSRTTLRQFPLSLESDVEPPLELMNYFDK